MAGNLHLSSLKRAENEKLRHNLQFLILASFAIAGKAVR